MNNQPNNLFAPLDEPIPDDVKELLRNLSLEELQSSHEHAMRHVRHSAPSNP